MENLKIVQLKAENIKKLVAIQIRPDGNVVELTGKNGQGKTSVLDAISWALEGQKVIQGEPIRKGQTKAWVELDLGDMIVKRSFRKDDAGQTTSSITVESKEGARFPSPQAMIDKLIGRLAFDPLAFARMKPREQFDELKRLVPGVDFEKIEALQRGDFERRTELNRKAKSARSAAAGIPFSEDGPVDKIDEAALIGKLDEAGKHNAEIERRTAARQTAREQMETKTTRASQIVEELNAETRRIQEETARRLDDLLKKAGEEQSKLLKEAAELREKLAAAPELPAPIDTAEVRAEIEKARKENEVRAARAMKIANRDEADRLEAEASGLTEAMEAREKEKRAAIEAAKLPVPGMGFGEGIVTLAGVPFDQASDAEQLRASIAIAMSLNPKLRVIRVRDGSLLDESSMKLLGEMAKDRDYQVWIERVDGSGKVGFVLEDGHVRAPAMAGAAAE